MTFELQPRKMAIDNLKNIMNTDPIAAKECAQHLMTLKEQPLYGYQLDNKNGKDLSDCRAVYFGNARYRIVYRIEGTYIQVLAIGERNDETVYMQAMIEKLKNDINSQYKNDI